MKLLRPRVIPLKASREKLLILDQVKLPAIVEWVECTDEKQVANSIRVMHVRGAPAIGIAAAFGFYLGVWKTVKAGRRVTAKRLQAIRSALDRSRPTAVNLFWATTKMNEAAGQWLDSAPRGADQMSLVLLLYSLACEIQQDDAERCYLMGEHTANFIEKKIARSSYRVLTHCNTGALATGGIGTALGAIRLLHSRGKVETVFADETRPYLQGSRLTAYELKKERIPTQLVVDSMAGYLMQKKMVDFVVVGADRITSGGDVANKIGTYSLSVLASAHNIPFVVVAPQSTFDMALSSGSDIPVEERAAREVLDVGETPVAARVPVLNYSFDITPRENITAIFSENGKFK